MRRLRTGRRNASARLRARGSAALLLAVCLQAFVGPFASRAWAAEGSPKVMVLPFRYERTDAANARAFTEALVGELKGRESVQWVPLPGRKQPRRERPKSKPSEALLREGRGLLDRQRFTEAIGKLNQAIELELSNVETVHFGRVREARLLLAVAFFRQGEDGEAKRTLQEVARLWPNLTLPGGKYPPVFARELDRAKEQVRAGKKGTLVVKAPRGSQVFLDGEGVGPGPAKLSQIPVGAHYVKVAWQGELYARQVEISAGAAVELNAAFEPAAEPAGGGAPRSARVLDEELASALQAYSGEAGADAVVVGVVAGAREGKLTVAAAIYSRAQKAFGVFPPVDLDAKLGMASVEAFKLADQVSAAAQGFSRGATLPFDLLEGAEVKVSAPVGPRTTAPEDGPKVTRLEPPPGSGEGTPANQALGRKERREPKAAASGGWPWWVWVAGGAGVAAIAGGTVFVVSEARKPVSGTVTARW